MSVPLKILQQADAVMEGWTCPSSTECCRFALTGREPWLTEAEWRVLTHEVKRQGRKLPKLDDAADQCPFLTDAGRCSVYAARPLGCRTFFCEKASGPNKIDKRALRDVVRQLEDASAQGVESRPLRSWLRSGR